MAPANSASAEHVWIDRRRSMRFPANDEAQVEVAGDPPVNLPAYLRDASRTGMRLALPMAVSSGAQIKIKIGDASPLLGQVRYCRSAGSVYYAGVELQGWS